MGAAAIEIRPFDPQQATDADFAALHVCTSHLQQEQWPDDPPGTADQIRREKQGVADHHIRRSWLAVREDTGAVIGIATGGYTEVFWSPDRPPVVWQGDTAVFPE